MSEQIKRIKTRGDEVVLTEFYGGVQDGVCLQLSPQYLDHIQLTIEQAKRLGEELNNWVDSIVLKDF
jgi:hypothetical protein